MGNGYKKAKGRVARNWSGRGTINPFSAKNKAINKAKGKASTKKKTGGYNPSAKAGQKRKQQSNRKRIGVNIY